MKRIDLVRELEKNGCVFVRSGANHDIYLNPRTGKKQPVPRHREIDDYLAKHIQKDSSLVHHPFQSKSQPTAGVIHASFV